MIIKDEQIFFGENIEIDGVGTLVQPKSKDIAKIGNDNYFNLLMPFFITKDNIKEQYDIDEIYDFFFLEDNQSLLQHIAACLNLFFQQDIEYGVEGSDIHFKVGEDGIVGRHNFEQLQEVIRKINCIKLPEPEKLPENITPEKLKIHEKMKFHRNRRAKIEEPTFKEIINTVMHKGSSFISYKEVSEFTYYQLINSYQVIVGLSNFDEYMGYKLSAKYEDPKEDMPHWQKIIKMI